MASYGFVKFEDSTVKIVRSIVTNIVRFPDKLKVRKIKLTNKTFKNEVQSCQSAMKYLMFVGFVEKEEFLTFPKNTSMDKLKEFHEKIEEEFEERFSQSRLSKPKKTKNPAFRTGAVHEITSEKQFNDLLSFCTETNLLLVVDFFATWCAPCVMISPFVISLANSEKEKVMFAKVDVDKNRSLMMKMGVKAMPTFQVFKNGKNVETIVGADIQKLQASIDSLGKFK